MVDEHVKRTIEAEKERFTVALEKKIASFEKLNEKVSDVVLKELKQVKESLSALTRFMYRLIDLNKLQEPELEKKKFGLGKKEPIKKEDDDLMQGNGPYF